MMRMRMRAMLLRVVAVVAVAAVVCGGHARAGQTGVPLWQGLDYAWEYRLPGGAKTPHRLGTWVSLPSGAAALGGAGSVYKGDVAMTYTTGVDGDYAYPATYVRVLSVGGGPGSDVGATTVDVSASWTDTATGSEDDPIAVSSVRVPQSVALDTLVSNATHATAVLTGFSLDMRCNGSVQPPGEVCNSNGIWASELLLGVDPASVAVSGRALDFDVVLNLTRGWTPDKGGGKPFNYRMTFDLTVRVAVFASRGAAGAFTAATGPVRRTGTLWGPSMGKVAAIQGTGGSGLDIGAVGIQMFGFALSSKDADERPGRYFESLAFYVAGSEYTASSGVASFSVVANIDAPLTVHDADVAYQVWPVLVQLDSSAGAGASMAQAVRGVVCEDVKLFYSCTKHGLPNSLSDTVAFTTTVDPGRQHG